MADIIEIDLENPYIRPNYQYIITRMEEGAVVIVHQRSDAVIMAKNMKRKNYKYGFTKQPNNTWKVFIKEGAGGVVVHADEKYNDIFKILTKGKSLTGKNKGELLTIMRTYKKEFPDSKQKIAYKMKEDGYTIWLE